MKIGLGLGVAIGDGVSALASLGVTFGGFGPTAMDGVEASKQYFKLAQEMDAERREAHRRNRQLEFARTSAPKTYSTEDGVSWTYVIVDNQVARITACESEAKRLVVPAEIEGHRVYAIAADACSRNDFVEEIICADEIESIGSCAFRFCSNLRKIVLPASVHEYSSTWLSHCPSLEEMVLPDRLETIALAIFDNTSLRKLSIGRSARIIEPGAFQRSNLVEIVVHPENPFLFTDGTALYSGNGSVLYALAKPVSNYEVREGCEVIAKKAFYGHESLTSVVVPEGVKAFDEFAFSHSGLVAFNCPSSLEVIADKAFFYCDNLSSVQLNEGLRRVGNSVFEETSLERLTFPASIESIGRSVTRHTNIVHSGSDCSLAIDERCALLSLDGRGGLYSHSEDGLHLIQLVDPELTEFSVQEGTVAIGEYAFAHNQVIKHVVIPEGVREIQKSAFRCCSNLAEVELPDSVAYIREDAFLDSGLERFRVPASLEVLGKNALVTAGAHHGDQMPTLRDIQVAPENVHFYMASGMLCRRVGGKSNVVLFNNNEPHVVFPPEIDLVESYAFNNARGIRYLELNPNLRLIETSGLTTWCWIEDIHIELSEPVEGRTSFDFRFPNTSKGIHGISMGIGGATWVNVPGIMAQYDNTVVHAHDYNSPRNPDSIPIYDQAKMIMARLNDPILLIPVNKNMYERLLRNYIVEICIDVARHDDRDITQQLVDHGYVTADNLEQIISAVGKLQDAAMTGYLLELKRRRFNQTIFDFDL